MYAERYFTVLVRGGIGREGILSVGAGDCKMARHPTCDHIL
jgi:hypothetical protein